MVLECVCWDMCCTLYTTNDFWLGDRLPVIWDPALGPRRPPNCHPLPCHIPHHELGQITFLYIRSIWFWCFQKINVISFSLVIFTIFIIVVKFKEIWSRYVHWHRHWNWTRAYSYFMYLMHTDIKSIFWVKGTPKRIFPHKTQNLLFVYGHYTFSRPMLYYNKYENVEWKNSQHYLNSICWGSARGRPDLNDLNWICLLPEERAFIVSSLGNSKKEQTKQTPRERILGRSVFGSKWT